MRFRKILSVLALLILNGENVAAHAHAHHPPVVTRTTRYIILGVLVGGIILALILAFVGVLVCQWIKRRKKPETTEDNNGPPGPQVTVVQVPANQSQSQSNSQSMCSASMPSIQTQPPPQVIHVVQGAPPNQGQAYPAQQYPQQPIQVQQYPPQPNQAQPYPPPPPYQAPTNPPPQYQAPPNGPPPQQQPVQVVYV
uniref:Basic proline-rich protein n=1 Tax=Panagrellus redivivus TaxID=6233 RepID=A0A7E4W5F0_PANRE